MNAILFFNYLSNLYVQHKKTVRLLAVFCFLWGFGDSVLPFIGHLLHVLLEVIESVLEHFLEEAFGFSERQAQVTLFYSFLMIMSLLAWYLLRKAYFKVLHGYYLALIFWDLPKLKACIRLALMLSALITTVYIFS